jgi:hypothetical protein
LQGNIVPEIDTLSSLATIDWSRNRLTGSIPESMTNLESLVFMSLEDNQLVGDTSLCEGVLPVNLVTLVVDCNTVVCGDGCCTCPPGTAARDNEGVAPIGPPSNVNVFEEFLDDVIDDETLQGNLDEGGVDVYEEELQNNDGLGGPLFDDDFEEKYVLGINDDDNVGGNIGVIDQNNLNPYLPPTMNDGQNSNSKADAGGQPITETDTPALPMGNSEPPSQKSVGHKVGLSFAILFVIGVVVAASVVMLKISKDDDDDTLRWMRKKGYSAVDRMKELNIRGRRRLFRKEGGEGDDVDIGGFFRQSYREYATSDGDNNSENDDRYDMSVVLPPPDDVFFRDLTDSISHVGNGTRNDNAAEEAKDEIEHEDDLSSRASRSQRSYHSHRISSPVPPSSSFDYHQTSSNDEQVTREAAFPSPEW